MIGQIGFSNRRIPRRAPAGEFQLLIAYLSWFYNLITYSHFDSFSHLRSLVATELDKV